MEEKEKQSFLVPGAVVIAGLLIAGAIFFTSDGTNNVDLVKKDDPKQEQNKETEKTKLPAPIREGDRIFGNPDAKITMFVYTDLECPFCRRYHATIKQALDEYGKDSRLNVIIRHYPLPIHENAKIFAIGAECSAEVGKSDTKMMEFMDKLFELEVTDVTKVASAIKLDKTEFANCIKSGKYDQKLIDDQKDGSNAGVNGTPNSILVAKDGQTRTIAGAYPYEDVKSAIEELLAQ